MSPPLGRFGNPPYKNTAYLAFAWKHPEIVVRSGNTYHNDQITAAYSLDGGVSWKAFVSEPPGTIGKYWRGEGPITISADGRTVVWSPTGVAPHLTQDWGATWYPCVGGSVNLSVAADTVNPSKFYAYDTEAGTIVVSTDGAQLQGPRRGPSGPKRAMGPRPGQDRTVPGREGEFWVISNGFLIRSADSGATAAEVKGVRATQIGFGKAAPGRDTPAIFIVGLVAGVEGLFRSDDGGTRWVRINDDAHGFGEMRCISGDPRIFGRVYFGTGGRGYSTATARGPNPSGPWRGGTRPTRAAPPRRRR